MNAGSYRKALIGLVTPFVAWLALKAGFDLDVDTQAAIVSAITGVLVYWLPNSP